MKADLETELWSALARGEVPRAVIARMLAEGKILHSKQAIRTLEKWESKGIYDSGVSIDLGWLRGAGTRPS